MKFGKVQLLKQDFFSLQVPSYVQTAVNVIQRIIYLIEWKTHYFTTNHSHNNLHTISTGISDFTKLLINQSIEYSSEIN
jgi:hypothetical protein